LSLAPESQASHVEDGQLPPAAEPLATVPYPANDFNYDTESGGEEGGESGSSCHDSCVDDDPEIVVDISDDGDGFADMVHMELGDEGEQEHVQDMEGGDQRPKADDMEGEESEEEQEEDEEEEEEEGLGSGFRV